jgi:hypothetical protein
MSSGCRREVRFPTSFLSQSAHKIRDRLRANLPTYRYQYAGNLSNVLPVGWMGAYHSGEYHRTRRYGWFRC